MMTEETQISEREREILRLVATGATNQQIAQQLNISINTVKVHLRNIFGKIGVVSRTEATLYAVRAGLVSLNRSGGPVAVADDPEAAEAEIEAPAPAAISEPAPTVAEPPAEAEPSAVAEPPQEPATPAIPAPPIVSEPAPARPASRLPLLLGAAGVVVVVAVVAVLLILRPNAGESPPATASAGLPGDSERWRVLAGMPAPRAAFALAGAAFEGRQYLYVIGGDDGAEVQGDTLRYDIASDRWVSFRAKPTPVADVRAVAVGSRIFVPGGRSADGSVSDALEAYDPQRDTWMSLAPLPAPRSRYGLAAVEGKIYLFGGWDGSEYRAEVFQYSPDADEWIELTPMPAPRADAGAAAVDGQIYVVGGSDESGPLTLNQRYNPAEEGLGNPWSIGAPLPEPRARAGASASNSFVFVLGEANDEGRLLSYSSALDAWTAIDLPAEPLSDVRIQAIGGKLFIFGGRSAVGANEGAYEYEALYIVQAPTN